MKTDRPILVIGRQGQLGRELLRALAPMGDIVATGREQLDLSQPDSVRKYLTEIQPSLVVNAAAYTAVDKAESDEAAAFKINAEAVGVLGEVAASLNAAVVHYSTDYVFAGTGEHFQAESQVAKPVSVYGRSKLAGEENLLAANPRSWILRTSWVFAAVGDNFLKTILRLWQSKEELGVVADQYGAPTSAALIADVTALLVSRVHNQQEPLSEGVYHLAASGVTTWHAYAKYIIAYANAQGLSGRFGEDAVRGVSTAEYPTAAQRPANSRLDCSKLQDALNIRLPDWEHGVEQVIHRLIKETL